MNQKHLRAGEFGAAARLSPKALRFYAESGLLLPASHEACVVPGTGDAGQRGLVEVAVAYDGTVEPVDDLYIRLVPAHTEAYLPVPAAYEDFPLILRVYDGVEAWTDAHPGVTCTGCPYEIYPGTDARFDVAYPVTD